MEGKVGVDVSEEEGYEAARLAGLSILGDLRRELGDLDRVVAWLRVFGMVNSLVDWYHPDGSIPPEALAAGVAGVLFQGLHR